MFNIKLRLMPAIIFFLLAAPAQADPQNYALVIHGGAGSLNMSVEKEAAYRATLKEALLTGQKILGKGGQALDAVEATIRVMENSPLFNAGKGAVFTHEGRNEMDASIMDGRDLNAGAVAGVMHIKNPISLAREVMTNSKHVLLAGSGAEEFARTRNIKLVEADYFKTDHRLKQMERAKKKEAERLRDQTGDKSAAYSDPGNPEDKFGTVGAVALDSAGNIAAGTSTGGMTNKRWKRIGDSPIIGAGTYADNNSCGVSGTGHGEFFIRAAVAHSICAMMEYKGVSLEEAAHAIIHEKLVKMGGKGGIIALDKDGNISMTFNTPRMNRGYIKGKSDPVVSLYK